MNIYEQEFVEECEFCDNPKPNDELLLDDDNDIYYCRKHVHEYLKEAYRISNIDKVTKHIKDNIKTLPVDEIIEGLNNCGCDIQILYDDNGHYCIPDSTMGNIRMTEEDGYSQTALAGPESFKPTIREALIYHIEQWNI